VVVVEHDRRHRPAERVGCLFLTDRRQYGDTELSFYRSLVRERSGPLAVYPGTFDPLTQRPRRHPRRSLKIFDRVVVALAENVPQGAAVLERRSGAS
jgi:hypothetical protein